MHGQRFQIKSPTIALLHSGGRKTAIMIPANETVTLLPDSVAEQTFVTIDWNGETLEVFLEDIRDRGEQVNSASAA